MNDAKKSKFAYELHQPQPPTVTFDRNANAAWDHGPGSCVQEFAVGLRLDISGRGDEAKLVWSDANSILAPYFINRGALVKAATSGNPKFFLGTDTAPHARDTKETECGCAGMYPAHAAIELYAEAFEAVDDLDKLEAFASHHGADFYGLPRNKGKITLEKSDWVVPGEYPFGTETVVPLRAGQKVAWKLKV